MANIIDLPGTVEKEKKKKVIDLSKENLFTYSDLQKLNAEPFDESKIPEEYRKKIKDINEGVNYSSTYDFLSQAPTKVMSPLGNSRTPWGESMFDQKYANQYEFENVQDIRAENQPWYAKIAAGIGKGAITAATTFADGTAGLIVGVASAIADKDIHKLWDNPFTRAMKEVTDEAEVFLPNYYTRAEQEDPWYWHIFSANFIGDKFIKNLGFTVGAMYSGGIYAKGISALGKAAIKGVKAARGAGASALAEARATGQGLTKIKDTIAAVNRVGIPLTRGMQAIVGSTISAINEGSIEALNNSTDWYNLKKRDVDQEYSKKIKELDQRAAEDPTVNRKAEYDALIKEYQSVLQNLEMNRASMGNWDLLMNIPILTVSNYFQFGRLWSNGWRTSSRVKNITGQLTSKRGAKGLLESVTSNIEAKKGKGQLIKALVKNPLHEGFEEINQKAASVSSGKYREVDFNNFYRKLKDKDAEDQNLDMYKALKDGIVETYADSRSWEEFFIGALTGMLGVPMFRRTKTADGKTQSPVYLEGGIYGAVRDYKADKKQAQELVERINKRVQSPEFINMYRGMLRHTALENEKEKFLGEKDEFNYKNADFQQLVSDIIMFDTAGKLDDLITMVKESCDFSDDAINEIVENTRDQETKKGPFTNDNGTSKAVTDEGKQEIIDFLKERQDKVLTAIDNYRKTKDNLLDEIQESIPKEGMDELVWMRMAIDNWTERAGDLTGDVKEYLKVFRDLAERSKEDYYSTMKEEHKDDGTKTDKYKEAEENAQNAEKSIEILDKLLNIKEPKDFVEYLKQNFLLVKELTDQVAAVSGDSRISVEQMLQIKAKMQDLMDLTEFNIIYTGKLMEYIKKPSKIKEDHDNVDQEEKDKLKNAKLERIKSKLDQAHNLATYRNILDTLTTDETDQDTLTKEERDELLKKLEESESNMHKNYRETNALYDYLVKTVKDDDKLSQTEKENALSLLEDLLNSAEKKEDFFDTNSTPFKNIGKFAEQSGSDEEAIAKFQNAYENVYNALYSSIENEEFKKKMKHFTPAEAKVDPADGKGNLMEDDNDHKGDGAVGPVQTTVQGQSMEDGDGFSEMPIGEAEDSEFDDQEYEESKYEPSPGDKQYIRPSLSKFAITLQREGKFVPTPNIPGMEKYKALYDKLVQEGAFDYVDSGKLKVGDTIHFMIDPAFDENTIFMVVKNGDKYQIVGSLDDSQSGLSTYEGLAELRERIKEEYNNRDKEEKSGSEVQEKQPVEDVDDAIFIATTSEGYQPQSARKEWSEKLDDIRHVVKLQEGQSVWGTLYGYHFFMKAIPGRAGDNITIWFKDKPSEKMMAFTEWAVKSTTIEDKIKNYIKQLYNAESSENAEVAVQAMLNQLGIVAVRRQIEYTANRRRKEGRSRDEKAQKRIGKQIAVLQDPNSSIIEKLTAISVLQQNVNRGDELTTEEQELVNSITKQAKEEGYEIVDYSGISYDEGMKGTFDFTENENVPQGAQVIDAVSKPLILKDGKMVQAAQGHVLQNSKDVKPEFKEFKDPTLGDVSYKQNGQQKQQEQKSEKQFISNETTEVSKIMVGKTQFRTEDVKDDNGEITSPKERSLDKIPGVLKSLADSSKVTPLFGVITNGVFFVNNANIKESSILKPLADQAKEGRLYLLIPNAKGGYSPALVRVKHLNRDEFDITSPELENNVIAKDIREGLQKLARAKDGGDIQAALKILNRNIYLKDIGFHFKETSSGYFLNIDRKERETSSRRLRRDGNGDYIISNVKAIKYSSLKEVTSEDGLVYDEAVPKDPSEIYNELLDLFYEFNLPIQVGAKRINTPGYNQRLINSGVLTTNLETASVQGSWFTTNYFDAEGNKKNAVNPKSIGRAMGESPVGGPESAVSGSLVTLKDGSKYNVEIETDTIRDESGNLVNLPQEQKDLVLWMAWADRAFGSSVNGPNLVNNKAILSDGRVLDRTEQRFLSDEEAKVVKEEAAGRLNALEAKRKATDQAIAHLAAAQENVDKEATDSDFYYIKEEEGQYHPYFRMHSRMGENFNTTEEQKKDIEKEKEIINKAAESQETWDALLEKYQKYRGIDPLDYNKRRPEDVKGLFSVIRDKISGIDSKSSTDAGSAVDNIFRYILHYDGTNKLLDLSLNKLPQPPNMDRESFENAKKIAMKMREDMIAKGQKCYTNNIVLYYKYDTPDGPLRIAGEVDALIVNPDGSVEIMDFKTSKNSFTQPNKAGLLYFDYSYTAPGSNTKIVYKTAQEFLQAIHAYDKSEWGQKKTLDKLSPLSTLEYYRLQLSGYKNLFETMCRVPVEKLSIRAVHINLTGQKGNKTVTRVFYEGDIRVPFNESVSQGMVPLIPVGTQTQQKTEQPVQPKPEINPKTEEQGSKKTLSPTDVKIEDVLKVNTLIDRILKFIKLYPKLNVGVFENLFDSKDIQIVYYRSKGEWIKGIGTKYLDKKGRPFYIVKEIVSLDTFGKPLDYNSFDYKSSGMGLNIKVVTYNGIVASTIGSGVDIDYKFTADDTFLDGITQLNDRAPQSELDNIGQVIEASKAKPEVEKKKIAKPENESRPESVEKRVSFVSGKDNAVNRTIGELSPKTTANKSAKAKNNPRTYVFINPSNIGYYSNTGAWMNIQLWRNTTKAEQEQILESLNAVGSKDVNAIIEDIDNILDDDEVEVQPEASPEVSPEIQPEIQGEPEITPEQSTVEVLPEVQTTQQKEGKQSAAERYRSKNKSNDANKADYTKDEIKIGPDGKPSLRVSANEEVAVWDKEKELAWLDKVLPQLAASERVKVIDGLIHVAEQGKTAWGTVHKGIMTLSNIAAKGTVYHEAFHMVFKYMLDDASRTLILQEARERWGDIGVEDLEEELAEAFREYTETRENRSLGRRILDFFKNLLAKILHWNKIQPHTYSLFRQINQGKFAGKKLNIKNSNTSYSQEMQDILNRTPRDSEGNLLAPNGKPSNLTERQYTQVEGGLSKREATKRNANWSDMKSTTQEQLLKKGFTPEFWEQLSDKFKDQALNCISF